MNKNLEIKYVTIVATRQVNPRLDRQFRHLQLGGNNLSLFDFDQSNLGLTGHSAWTVHIH